METIRTNQTSETFDTNIAAFDDMTPDKQRQYLEVAYDNEAQEELPYRAETVLKVGGIALEAVNEHEQAEVEVEDQGVERDIDFDKFLGDAELIIARLFMGDESALLALPQEFQNALRERMEYRKQQLEDGAITEGYMQEELDKMCSVASVGLAMKRYPDAFGE